MSNAFAKKKNPTKQKKQTHSGFYLDKEPEFMGWRWGIGGHGGASGRDGWARGHCLSPGYWSIVSVTHCCLPSILNR